MPTRRDHWSLLGLGALSALLLLAGTVGAMDVGLLPYCAPLIVAALPLLAGFFPGEEIFARRIRVRRVRRRPSNERPQPFRRTSLRLLARGGSLIAEAMATRPPPAAALVS